LEELPCPSFQYLAQALTALIAETAEEIGGGRFDLETFYNSCSDGGLATTRRAHKPQKVIALTTSPELKLSILLHPFTCISKASRLNAIEVIYGWSWGKPLVQRLPVLSLMPGKWTRVIETVI
jgi:hypothetical protein